MMRFPMCMVTLVIGGLFLGGCGPNGFYTETDPGELSPSGSSLKTSPYDPACIGPTGENLCDDDAVTDDTSDAGPKEGNNGLGCLGSPHSCNETEN
jgi:hypothetical protein